MSSNFECFLSFASENVGFACGSSSSLSKGGACRQAFHPFCISSQLLFGI